MAYMMRIKDKDSGVLISKIFEKSLTETSMEYSKRYDEEERQKHILDISEFNERGLY